MQSKTSCFKTIVIKNITRFWPLWAINCFAWVIAPIAIMLNYSHPSTGDIADILYGGATAPLPVYCLCYSCVVAMAVWSYLYTGKSVGLMHSLPITRNRLFAASFVSGLIIELIPIAAGGLVLAIFSIVGGGFVLLPFVLTTLIAICEAFIFFSIATFMAHLTGHLFALPVLYFVLNFLAVLLEYVVNTYIEIFGYGLSGEMRGYTTFLCPTIKIYENVENITGYATVYEDGEYIQRAAVKLYSPATHYIRGWGTIAAYVAVGAVLVAISLFLYQKRKSETAGEIVSAKVLRPVALVCFTACAALTGGLALYYIFDGDGSEASAALMALCMTMSTFIGYFGGQMIMQRKLRVFNKRTFLEYAIGVAVCIFFLAIMRGGCFGREKFVPKAANVQKAEFNVMGSGTGEYSTENPEAIADIIAIHQLFVDKKKEVNDSRYRTFSYYNDSYTNGGRVRITYIMKNGSTLYRDYYLQVWSDDHELDELTNSIRAFTENREYMLECLRADRQKVIENVDLGMSNFYNQDAEDFYNALIEDIKEGTYKNYSFTAGNFRVYHCYIGMRLLGSADQDDGHSYWRYLDFYINPDMRHCMKFMQMHDVDMEEFLVNY